MDVRLIPWLLMLGTCSHAPIYEVCESYRNLSEPWRNHGFTSTKFPGWPKDDSRLREGWYRFTGIGGDVLYHGCFFRSSSHRGGTHNTLSLCRAATYPRAGDGVRPMGLCSGTSDLCSGSVNVLACPAGFYLYYLYPSNGSWVTAHRSCASSSCGPLAQCVGKDGGCMCDPGYKTPSWFLPTGHSYGCRDIVDRCGQNRSLCGPNALCITTDETYICQCHHGYRLISSQRCQDIDECAESRFVCGNDPFSICINTQGGFQCECMDGYIPSPNLIWEKNLTVCRDVRGYFPDYKSGKMEKIVDLIRNIKSEVLPQRTVTTLLDEITDVTIKPTDENIVIESSEKLIASLVAPTLTQKSLTLVCKFSNASVLTIGPNVIMTRSPELKTEYAHLEVDLVSIAKNNNGSASVALITYNSTENVLSPSLFTARGYRHVLLSKVVSVTLPRTPNANLLHPANLTLKHVTSPVPRHPTLCVHWADGGWRTRGCHITDSNFTHTVCTCAHLSTFALIMQLDTPAQRSRWVQVLSAVATSVGLIFLGLATLTFALCRWNPRVNNVARLNLCVSLLLAHLLFLLVQSFLYLVQPHKVLCQVLAGVLHFLFLSCFVWMVVEAAQLFMLVRKLKQVKANERAGPHWACLSAIGYGVALLVVAVSGGLRPNGYGSDQCWLKTDGGLIWSFLGPVCFILASNLLLFIAILVSLHSTLRETQSDVSKVKYTRVLVFKIMVQFIILGCPWILGFFTESSLVLEVIFLILTSQQGTFIFLVHCVLNDEVQRQYKAWWANIRPRHQQTTTSQTGIYSLTRTTAEHRLHTVTESST
ncbi:adhesion G protein-coupled receptor E2-like [Denticeps clupeoides]|uniref:adhesion G protein-coupled receptor E2-like n=1 Tax=Denticeps clupeoides TaxID=299321 RepID=UPI0010A588B3|nr:adhesion G protein-coupled receptor E2-like [Denticeps clupeoides]